MLYLCRLKIRCNMKNLQEVRAGIIDAAEKHFSILGFEKTTLDGITEMNGRSKTSIYYHFKNKHEIFKSVIEKEFGNVMDDLQKVLENGNASRLEMMRNYLRARLDSLQNQGAFKRFASSRFAYSDNPVSRAVKEARASFDNWEKGYFEASVMKGKSEGTIPDEIIPTVFSTTVINILKALELQFFANEGKSEVAETYKGMIDLIVR